MKVGDLVFIVAADDNSKHGVGLYLGKANRGDASFLHSIQRLNYYYAFLWKGRVATFDEPYWCFNVLNDGGNYGKERV